MDRLDTLKQKLLAFRNERDWKQFHNPKDLAIALSIEASELQEIMLWRDTDQIKTNLGNPAFCNRLQEECADILNYLILFAEVVGFDVIEAAHLKIVENGKKYPVDKSKGSARKYNEF